MCLDKTGAEMVSWQKVGCALGGLYGHFGVVSQAVEGWLYGLGRLAVRT